MDGADELVFVYNADGGAVNGLLDWAHKLLSPATYDCRLCALTYGNLGMKKEWRRFLEGLGRPVSFLHCDELAAREGVTGAPLPALYARRDGRLQLLIGAGDMNRCRTLEELERLVLEKTR
jgi:hypothetical protein